MDICAPNFDKELLAAIERSDENALGGPQSITLVGLERGILRACQLGELRIARILCAWYPQRPEPVEKIRESLRRLLEDLARVAPSAGDMIRQSLKEAGLPSAPQF